LDVRNLLLDEPHAFDSLYGAADIVLIAGSTRKNERINDNVFDADAVIFRKQFHRATGYLKLALARDGLRLFFVFVNATDDKSAAVFARKRRDKLEFLKSVFEVDRIDD